MKYTCDTEGGSSGSPVLSRVTNKVVALHHCGGGCNGNLGAPLYQFYDMLDVGSSAPTASKSPTGTPTTASPTASPSVAPSVPSSSFGPTPSSWGTGEPTGSDGSPTKSPSTSPSAAPTAAPTPAQSCEGLGKKDCKANENCDFGKGKITVDCMAKKKSFRHDCSQHSANECTSDNAATKNLCEVKNGACAHVCDGEINSACKRKKDTLNKKKVCTNKMKNPCKKCKPKSCQA